MPSITAPLGTPVPSYEGLSRDGISRTTYRLGMVEIAVEGIDDGQPVSHAMAIVFAPSAVTPASGSAFDGWNKSGHQTEYRGENPVGNRHAWSRPLMGEEWAKQGFIPHMESCYLIDSNVEEAISLADLRRSGVRPRWFQQLFTVNSGAPTTVAPFADGDETYYWVEHELSTVTAFWVVDPPTAGPSTGATVLSSFGQPVRADRPRRHRDGR